MAKTSISQWAKKTQDKADILCRKLVLDVDKSVIQRSPVDTGKFKGDWQLGVNAQPIGVTEIYDKNGGGTLAYHESQIPLKAAGHKYFIVNNSPYAWALEYGHSGQAPFGMVELTTIAFQSTVDRIAQELS